MAVLNHSNVGKNRRRSKRTSRGESGGKGHSLTQSLVWHVWGVTWTAGHSMGVSLGLTVQPPNRGCPAPFLTIEGRDRLTLLRPSEGPGRPKPPVDSPAGSGIQSSVLPEKVRKSDHQDPPVGSARSPTGEPGQPHQEAPGQGAGSGWVLGATDFSRFSHRSDSPHAAKSPPPAESPRSHRLQKGNTGRKKT